MVEPGYELFDHTADIGIRAWAPAPGGLIRPAGEGLYAVIGELVAGAPANAATWDLTGDDMAVLLRDYLGELLVLFERDRRMVVGAEAREFGRSRLIVEAEVRPVDESRSLYNREVKAITYHGLEIVETAGRFEASIIVDI